MNPKIVIAFVSGALLASGIVFLAVRQELEPRSEPRLAQVSKPAPPKAPPPGVVKPVVAVAPTPLAVTPPARVPVKERLSLTPIHEKPSPLVPRARQGAEALVAI